MLVIRPAPVVQDRVQLLQVPRLRLEPGFDVLQLDRDDAAVVARGGDFGRVLVDDGGEGVQLRLAVPAGGV